MLHLNMLYRNRQNFTLNRQFQEEMSSTREIIGNKMKMVTQ